MKYTNNEIINCLRKRVEWYEKAIKIRTGQEGWDHNFVFPDDPFNNWRVAIKELKNKIDMLTA